MKITTKFNLGDVVYFVHENRLMKGSIKSFKTSTITCGGILKPLTDYGNTATYRYCREKTSKPYTTISYDIVLDFDEKAAVRPTWSIPNVTEDRLFSTKEELLKKFVEDCE